MPPKRGSGLLVGPGATPPPRESAGLWAPGQPPGHPLFLQTPPLKALRPPHAFSPNPKRCHC